MDESVKNNNQPQKEIEQVICGLWEGINEGKYVLIIILPLPGAKEKSQTSLWSDLCSYCLFSGIAKAWSQAYFGEGSGPVMLDEVRCTGNELSIEQCPKSSWGEHNCDHKEDAGVSCTPLTGKNFTPLIYQLLPPAPFGLAFPFPQFRKCY